MAKRAAILVDADAWNRVGAELRRLDPQRFAALLEVAENICAIHRDAPGGTSDTHDEATLAKVAN